MGVERSGVIGMAPCEQGRAFICIVDDDISCREAIGGLVASFGYQTKCFESGQEFLDCQPLDQAACLILDVKMAGMTGLELQARFLASGGIAPIVFISSFDDSETRAKALDAGAVGFLGKPFDRQALMDLIWSQPIPTY